jgi:hypothetical protein
MIYRPLGSEQHSEARRPLCCYPAQGVVQFEKKCGTRTQRCIPRPFPWKNGIEACLLVREP